MTEPSWLKQQIPQPLDAAYDVCGAAELRYFQFTKPNSKVSFAADGAIFIEGRLVAQIVINDVVFEGETIQVTMCEKNPMESFSVVLPDGQELGARNGIFLLENTLYVATPPTINHPGTWYTRRRINPSSQAIILDSYLGKLLVPLTHGDQLRSQIN